ncbi:RAD55 family ATPase [Massilia sp. DWR3-1-1]|uniref:RAD55 family ATPase n=1 Tax=Massilia sp. DWR3-1-1 TaxID=2804559 RepID=UPI003CF28685
MARTLPKMATTVAGLDTVLGGGLPAGGLYLVQGLAGSGKTTLAGQIGFQHARAGRKVVVFTLLGEAHVKMLSHFSSFSFFDEDVIGKNIVFFSAYAALMEGGLRALLGLLVSTMAQEQPHLLIIDGFRSIRNSSASDIALAEFMHSLNSIVSSMQCTTFLLSPVEGNVTDSENTLVDGVIELGLYRQGMAMIRELQVFKVRGAKHLLGKHVFEIAADGLVVYPRFEALCSGKQAPPMQQSLLSVGIPSWDQRIGGGINSGSITCLLGSPGAGKTTMGLHFIAEGLAQGEDCLIVGFHESPAMVVHKARRVGLDFEQHVASGRLAIMWQLPLEILIDDIASRMLKDIEARKVTRLLIDGAEGLDKLIMHPERSRGYLVALTNEFRLRGVTGYITQQLSYFKRGAPEVTPLSSALYDNVMLLEYLSVGALNHRRIAVMKLRENAYDSANRLFTISDGGIVVGEPIAITDGAGGAAG